MTNAEALRDEMDDLKAALKSLAKRRVERTSCQCVGSEILAIETALGILARQYIRQIEPYTAKAGNPPKGEAR